MWGYPTLLKPTKFTRFWRKKLKKKDSSLFLTSEFARLCHTTKDTLFHYDDIGLLKPHLVKENGYRYYSIDQLYLYEIIYELKGIGCSLDEIRQYLNFQSEVTFSDFLSRKEDDLREELIRIHRSMEFMENTRHMMDDAASAEHGVRDTKRQLPHK